MKNVEQPLLSLLETFCYATKIDIGWFDMDAAGHVNHTKYFTYAESSRMKLFTDIGFLNSNTNGGPIMKSINETIFYRPVIFPSKLLILSSVNELTKDRFTMDHLMVSIDSELVFKTSLLLIGYNYIKKEKQVFSKKIYNNLKMCEENVWDCEKKREVILQFFREK